MKKVYNNNHLQKPQATTSLSSASQSHFFIFFFLGGAGKSPFRFPFFWQKISFSYVFNFFPSLSFYLSKYCEGIFSHKFCAIDISSPQVLICRSFWFIITFFFLVFIKLLCFKYGSLQFFSFLFLDILVLFISSKSLCFTYGNPKGQSSYLNDMALYQSKESTMVTGKTLNEHKN